MKVAYIFQSHVKSLAWHEGYTRQEFDPNIGGERERTIPANNEPLLLEYVKMLR